MTKGLALFLAVVAAGVLADASGPAAGAGSAAAASVRLKAVSVRAHGNGTSLVIEASEPVAYVSTRPDPLTVLVECRNVDIEGVATSLAPDARGPIAGVAVESADSIGSSAARVRITLAQPVAHRVRADRNTIVVDFDKPSATAAPYVLPPSSRAGAAVSRQTPDAMAALQQVEPAAADPIAALGLGSPPSPAAAERPASGAPPGRDAAPGPFATQSPTTTGLTPSTLGLARSQAALPVPAQPPADQLGTPRTERRFTGNPVSLDFQGADLRAVLRTFAEISGLNIVIDPAVTGTVDVALRDVPWDQALDIILRANKLGYIVDGTIVRIAPLTALAEEEAQRRRLSDEQALAGELRVLMKTLSYARADEMQALITRSALSPRGSVQVDPRTNTLIISDLSDRLTLANDLIVTLDKPQPQVEIEARIVQTNKDYARALGVQWGFNGRVDPALGNTTPLAFPNSGNLGGRTGATQGPTGSAAVQPTGVNLAVPGAPSAVGLALGSINGAFNLDMALSALERSGNGRILSTPRVSTQNNVEAEVTQGVQIPIQTVANNTVTVTFRDAALTLRVTPQITSAETVIMRISVENASPDFSRAINNIPPINTQRANTTVLVSDGMTTVIGGIFISREQTSNDRTPGLSRIPFLGWLFKRDSLTDESTELLIFITPRIIKG